MTPRAGAPRLGRVLPDGSEGSASLVDTSSYRALKPRRSVVPNTGPNRVSPPRAAVILVSPAAVICIIFGSRHTTVLPVRLCACVCIGTSDSGANVYVSCRRDMRSSGKLAHRRGSHCTVSPGSPPLYRPPATITAMGAHPFSYPRPADSALLLCTWHTAPQWSLTAQRLSLHTPPARSSLPGAAPRASGSRSSPLSY